MTLKDAGGASVAGTTTYSAATRTATFTPGAALAGFVKHTVTVQAKDTDGLSVSSGGSWSFTTAKPDPAPGVCPCSLYSDSTTPTILQAADTAAVTLGVRFSPTVDGTVTGVRFYKGPGNTGTHVGTLWSAAGTQLATATFTGESQRRLADGDVLPAGAGHQGLHVRRRLPHHGRQLLGHPVRALDRRSTAPLC